MKMLFYQELLVFTDGQAGKHPVLPLDKGRIKTWIGVFDSFSKRFAHRHNMMANFIQFRPPKLLEFRRGKNFMYNGSAMVWRHKI